MTIPSACDRGRLLPAPAAEQQTWLPHATVVGVYCMRTCTVFRLAAGRVKPQLCAFEAVKTVTAG